MRSSSIAGHAPILGLITTLLALTLMSCASEPREKVERADRAITVSHNQEILTFEWQAGWKSSQARLALSPTHSQGASSLQITNTTGWAELVSAPLTSLGVGRVRTIAFDFMPPSPAPNPWWFGEVQVLLDAPSLGIYTAYLGRQGIDKLTPGKFNTVSFVVPEQLGTQLARSYADLTVRIVVNGPAGATYRVDNARLNGKSVDPAASLPRCNPYATVLTSGDVRYELRTPAEQSKVELTLRKNGVDSVVDLTGSATELSGGGFRYRLDDAVARYVQGDVMRVRFRLRARGTAADVFVPGPDAATFSDELSYEPAARCLPVRDTDLDNVPDEEDACPGSAKKGPGWCGCAVLDELDRDGDHVPDCVDECPLDASKTVAGDCGCADAPLPAGTACADGPCPGKHTCDARGQCGSAVECAIEGTVGLPKAVAAGPSIYLLVPNASVSWDEVGRKLPEGYERLQIDDATESKAVEALILKYYGPTQCVWTGARVTEPGIVSTFGDESDVGRQIWNESAPRQNVENSYLRFPPGEPKPGVSQGCVAMDAQGQWRVEDCAKPCVMMYERSGRSLISRVTVPAVGCGDFPGVDCKTRDGLDETCVPEEEAFAGVPLAPEANTQIDACNDCQKNEGADCSADCVGAAAEPAPGDHCFHGDVGEQAVASHCAILEPRRDAAGALITCGRNADCAEPGEVCGLYRRQGEGGQPTDSKDQECDPGSIGHQWIMDFRPHCEAVHVCGVPAAECESDPSAPDEPHCEPGSSCDCVETRVCGEGDPRGDSDPHNSSDSELSSTRFEPSQGALPLAEPEPDVVRDEPPTLDPDTQQHAWCAFAPRLPEQRGSEDTKRGNAGKGSLVELDFDPNLYLRYNLTPLAQGDLDFNIEASAQFKASARFSFEGMSSALDIIDAKVAALASRCRVQTVGKLEVFGLDFLPLIDDPSIKRLSHAQIGDDTGECQAAVAAFEEVASRTKKAMRDAQELLRQYHEGLSRGECFDALALCKELMAKAPPGFPVFDCELDAPDVEDIINLFSWHYERQYRFDMPAPPGFEKFRNLRVPNVKQVDPRLGNVRLPRPLHIPDFAAPEDAVTALPDLAAAQEELLKLSKDKKDKFEGMGCSGDKIKTEKQTLMTIKFALGPIPMLVEVEGVLKYGIDYDVDYEFHPNKLVTNSKDKDVVALVGAHATPCASAGIALFVGAGFSGGGFKAAAGVEGVVNLITLSMPAHASASIKAAREQVKLVDPLIHKLTAGAPEPVRYVAKELRELWDGEVFPVYRQRVYFGYEYGASIQASEFLRGKLSATAAIKFWRFKRKWRTTLVDFPGLDPFTLWLLHGKYEDSAATGAFPWVETLDTPDPFVRFKKLKHVPSELMGFTFPELRQALRARSLAFPPGELKLPALASIGKSLADLTMIDLPAGQLERLRVALDMPFSLDELEQRLIRAGVSLDRLSLADFAKLGFTLPDFAAWPLSDDAMEALSLDLSQLVKLGFDFSGIELSELELEPKPGKGKCQLPLDMSRVVDFFYDRLCKKPVPPDHLSELVSLEDFGRASTGVGDSVHRLVQRTYDRPIDHYEVWVEQGVFDDHGEVLTLHDQAPLALGDHRSCDGVAPLGERVNITSHVDLADDMRTLRFDLSALDQCGTWVGWSNVKVRYVVDYLPEAASH